MPMGGRDRRPSREEEDLWRHVTGDVKPMARREKPPATAARKTAPPVPRSKTRKPPTATELRKPVPAPKPHVPELAHGAAPGVDRKTADNLRRGRMPIEARLDLHGMTQAQAHGRLVSFIEGHQAAGKRCVLVVTGKGTWREEGGVLREAVPRWLNTPELRPRILSFSHAQRKDGGEGALYILLKRLR
jgi:DNA-nicking Smr family endonuclease